MASDIETEPIAPKYCSICMYVNFIEVKDDLSCLSHRSNIQCNTYDKIHIMIKRKMITIMITIMIKRTHELFVEKYYSAWNMSNKKLPTRFIVPCIIGTAALRTPWVFVSGWICHGVLKSM